jgi:hypothetical protein
MPSREEEAVRDFIRGRGDLVDDLMRTKQRIQKFLLRHGYRYENTHYWTGLHLKWLGGLEFEQALEQESVLQQRAKTAEGSVVGQDGILAESEAT